MKRKFSRRVRKRRLSSRNFDDPRYKEWRKDVYKRDGYRCQWPGCKMKKSLTAHHIQKWASSPALRFILSNGITLCYLHHKKVTGCEEAYAPLFLKLVQEKNNG